MNIRSKKERKNKETGEFCDFFLHASPKEKERVFTDAARRANEEQREVLKKTMIQFKAN